MNTLEKVMEKWKNGFKFKKPYPDSLIGECAWWVQQFTNCPIVGSSLKDKKRHLDSYIKVGLAFERGKEMPKKHYAVMTSDSITHGHLASIAEFDNDDNPTKMRLAECNYKAPCTVSYDRWVSLNSEKILGFIKCDLRPEFKVEVKTEGNVVPEWGVLPLQKATQKGIIFLDNNYSEDISPKEMEEVFHKLGFIQQKLGGFSRIRFITALDKAHLLD